MSNDPHNPPPATKRLVVTGADGFLGSAVVERALAGGHQVIAVTRRPRAGVAPDGRTTWIQADLATAGDDLATAMKGADAVIHLAASKSGAADRQQRDTVDATRRLIDAMHAAGVRRLICASSFSVYDYRRLSPGDRLDEGSPTESRPKDRDIYCQTKLRQESIIREDPRLLWTILRPGVIVDHDNASIDRLGIKLTCRLWICIGGSTLVPVTFRDNCADAVVRAAESDRAIGQVLNVVDDDPPTQRQYAAWLRRASRPTPTILTVPRSLAGAIATTCFAVLSVFRLERRLPHILRPAGLAARTTPFIPQNARAKHILGWQPRKAVDHWARAAIENDSAQLTSRQVERS